MSWSLVGVTKVRIGSRACGAVSIMLMSRIPASAMCSVRGIGVALIVRTSTSVRSRLRNSFWRTPKRCSSSMTTRPRFLNLTSFCTRRWVPITMSTLPSARPAMTSRCSGLLRNRESISTRTGNAANRWLKVVKCCSARTVVGTSTATWRPLLTALKAARSATSVLPNPTSPTTRRSIGSDDSIPSRTDVDGGLLIGGFLIGKGVGELVVPDSVRSVRRGSGSSPGWRRAESARRPSRARRGGRGAGFAAIRRSRAASASVRRRRPNSAPRGRSDRRGRRAGRPWRSRRAGTRARRRRFRGGPGRERRRRHSRRGRRSRQARATRRAAQPRRGGADGRGASAC